MQREELGARRGRRPRDRNGAEGKDGAACGRNGSEGRGPRCQDPRTGMKNGGGANCRGGGGGGAQVVDGRPTTTKN